MTGVLEYSALKSPQILELSGIGNPNLLRRIGVPTKVDLPGVGTNVQEHMIVGVSFGKLVALTGPASPLT